MSIDPEVAAELDLVRLHLGQILAAQDAIEVARDGIMTSLGRLTILLSAEPAPDPEPEPEPEPDPEAWPSTWGDRKLWIAARAGTKTDRKSVV